MIEDEITYQLLRHFPFEPTREQRQAMAVTARFLTCRAARSLMILRGSAGTGKTALSGAIVRALVAMKQRVVLLAPTGRAAKVFSLSSGHAAFTIHRRIYREQSYQGVDGTFSLAPNLQRDTLFMVDESSMIANSGMQTTAFGSGRLLDDLVSYVYAAPGCRLMLIGDAAQLPPVGEEESPALSERLMSGYGLEVFAADLSEVLRQGEDSGILYNATVVRQMITRDTATQLPKIRFRAFADIERMPGGELIEALQGSYSSVGLDETMVITRSNKRANIYNQGIRNTVLDREELLSTGDMLMMVRNNYYWIDSLKEEAKKAGEDSNAVPMTFLANGDRARVQRVRNVRNLYGFNFADVWLRFPDYDDFELQATVLLDTLSTEAPALSREQNEALFAAVMEDYADIPQKAERMKSLRADRYFNALQVKFAYAVTCHKAQGGQWAHVYVDQGYMTDEMLSPDYLHWLYTAFTRATEKLYLVNWPKTQEE